MARPAVVQGSMGAAATASPLATGAALELLAAGGSAVDAAIAAQAALAVVLPASCGLGGDGLSLVATPDGGLHAVNGTGRSPLGATAPGDLGDDGGPSVTVPGAVAAWGEMHARWGRRPWAACLAPAVRLARRGAPVHASTAAAATEQADRLARGGAAAWSLLRATAGERVAQPELAEALAGIAERGPSWFMSGPLALAMAAAAQRAGGRLSVEDLRDHATPVLDPVVVPWAGGQVAVQPPVTQGVLLAAALRWFEAHEAALRGTDPLQLDHLAVEVTLSAFAWRHRIAAEGAALLDEPLDVDPSSTTASGRGGPRAYLHTAGVAVADADGLVVSSLVSVFDAFGSCVYVPEGGFVLNDRAAGFTRAPNDAGPAKRPVHTLAPALARGPGGAPTAVATPGADGQVQTLLQILVHERFGGAPLVEGVGAPRWRSESGELLVGEAHPRASGLQARGHRVRRIPDGDDRFGAVVAAGVDDRGVPWAAGDWRREVHAGAI